MNAKTFHARFSAQRALQLFCAILWVPTLAFTGYLCLALAIHLLVFTSYRWIILAYLLWIWVFDKDVCDRGGRRFDWMKKLGFWRHFQDYFPVSLERVEDAEFEPGRNYLFCAFPHGVIPIGCLTSFLSGYSGSEDLFPYHETYPLILGHNFLFPFFRDVLLASGTCSPSAKSLNYLLSRPGGGNIAVLNVGGVQESYYCKPGNYKVCLKNRKGFVRVAIKNGAPLVPVFSFGECETFDQLQGEFLRNLQEKIRKVIGIAPLVLLGFAPKRVPITCVVGKPLDVLQSDNPTEEEVDMVHQKFCNRLVALFEEFKHRYIQNAEGVELVIS